MAPTAALRALAEPLLARAGLELWDVEISRDLLRFLVDRAEGVDLDALAEANRVVSQLLDDHDELVPTGAYQLEVSSPGLERTLRSPDHYRRYVGATVSVKTLHPVDGSRRHRGVLTAADETGCQVLSETAAHAPLQLSYDQIERTRTVFEWAPAPKPGARAGGRRAATRAGAAHDPKDLTR